MDFFYNIAGFPVQITTSLTFSPLDRVEGFNVFSVGNSLGGVPVLRYSTIGKLSEMADVKEFTEISEPLKVFDFDDEDIECSFFRDGSRLIFKMVPHEGEIHLFVGRYADDGCFEVISNWEENKHRSMLRFSLWMAFGCAAAPLGAIPIHSSVIACDGKAVLFLGESGTGKSTHTRLWRENIPGTYLLNDDSPILSVRRGAGMQVRIIACGSPWSGKTPCFRDESLPVASIVRLSQAPHNKITPLSKMGAFGAIYPSCPPSFAKDEALSDNICETISDIIAGVPCYHLECLPDAAAALLSHNTIFHKS